MEKEIVRVEKREKYICEEASNEALQQLATVLSDGEELYNSSHLQHGWQLYRYELGWFIFKKLIKISEDASKIHLDKVFLKIKPEENYVLPLEDDDFSFQQILGIEDELGGYGFLTPVKEAVFCVGDDEDGYPEPRLEIK